jgi:hypothetical protein
VECAMVATKPPLSDFERVKICVDVADGLLFWCVGCLGGSGGGRGGGGGGMMTQCVCL